MGGPGERLGGPGALLGRALWELVVFLVSDGPGRGSGCPPAGKVCKIANRGALIRVSRFSVFYRIS